VGKITYARATLADAAEMEGCLRAADIAELEAAGLEVNGSVVTSVRVSLWAVTARVDGAMVCVFGVAPLAGSLLADTGVPWMLGSNLVRRHHWSLIKESRHYIAAMNEQFDTLLNYVHTENVESVRWLKRMGFTLDEAKPHGPSGALFHRFEVKHV